MSKKATEVQKVKVSQGISYAEAVKKVKQTDAPKPVAVESNHRPCGGIAKAKADISDDMLMVGKNEFVLFMVEVINCSAQASRKTEKIKIIVRAAEKYLGLEGISWEAVEDMLAREASNSQTWVGGSSCS